MTVRYTRTAPNGKRYSINGPEGASENEIRTQILIAYPEAAGTRVAAREIAKEQEKPAPKRSLKDYAGIGGRAVMRGIGSLGEMAQTANPINAVARAAANYMPEGKARQFVQALAPDANVLAEQGANALKLATPETSGEKLGSAIIEGGVSSIAPGGGLKSVGMGVLSGMLGSGAGEVVRQSGGGTGAQIAASLAAGMSPAALSPLKQGAGFVRSHLGDAEERAAQAMRKATHGPAEQVAARLSARGPARSGARPTLGEVAQDPGLAALERQRASTNIAERKVENATLRGETLERAAGPGDPEAIKALGTRQARREEQRIAADLARQEAARTTALGAAKEKVGPVAERADVGAELRGDIEGEYEIAKLKTQNAYENPVLHQEHPVRIDKPFHAQVTDLMYRYYGNAAGDPPKGVQKILNDLLDWSKSQRTGKELTNTSVIANVDRRLADYAGEMSMRGRKTEAAFANKVRQTLDDNVGVQMPDDFKAALADAKAARNEQGLKFEDPSINPVAKAVAKGKINRDKVSDVQLPEVLVKRGTAGGTAAQALVRAVGRDVSEPRVRQVVRELIDTGKLTADNVGDFKHLLKEYPGIKAHVENLHVVDEMHQVKALDDLFKATPLAGATPENLNASRYVGKLLRDENTTDFETFVKQVTDSGDQDAVGGLRRALAEHVTQAGKSTIEDASGTNVPDVVKSIRAVDLVLDRAGSVLTPEQKQVFEAIRSELGGTRYAKTAGVIPTTESVDRSIPFVQSGAVARTIRFMLGKLHNEGRMNALIERAILDPKYATDLLKRKTPNRTRRLLRTLRTSAYGTVQSMQQVEEPPEQEY